MSTDDTDPRVAAINGDQECPYCGAGWEHQEKITAGRWHCGSCSGAYKPGENDA